MPWEQRSKRITFGHVSMWTVTLFIEFSQWNGTIRIKVVNFAEWMNGQAEKKYAVSEIDEALKCERWIFDCISFIITLL